MIRLQRIYNLRSIHAVILSFLDVLQSFYSNFISFFGTNLLTQCPVSLLFFACFLHRRKPISNGVQTPRNFLEIFSRPEGTRWARAAPGGVPRGGTTHQGAPRPRGTPRCVVPTSVASRTSSLHYKIPKYSETHRGYHRSEVTPLQGSVPPKTNLDPFRHLAGGGNHLRWPSTSSQRPPR